jgi:RHS repeat-associated protein
VYTYQPTSARLATVTDPKQQVTTYSYALDGAVVHMVFSNAQTATPSVSYTYDPVYSRVSTMVDGTGTTTYTYHPAGGLGAGQVASVDGPLANDTITYTYDELGRVASRAINGAANTTTQMYDALGRVTSETNVLGTFTYGYVGATGRLAQATYPNGQTSSYGYYGPLGDGRLQTIHHQRPGGATLSKFDYTYDAVGNILTWQQQADSDAATLWTYGYDAADQLTAAIHQTTGGTASLITRYAYSYDPAGNRTSEQIDDAVTLATHDRLNRLLTHASGGPLVFKGALNEPGTVTINGVPAAVDATNQFQAAVPVTAGTNSVTINAVDASGNAATAIYEVDQANTSKAFAYDANGNMTADGTRTFEWDARNQLVAVNVGTHRSEFTYNGEQQRVRVVEKENGVVQSDTKALWCNNGAICEERAADGVSVTRRIFADGEQIAGSTRFFAADHLGNVTDVSDGSAAVLGRYGFDAWGGRTLTSGTDVTSLGFTGHQWQASTALWQAWYRAYDSELGRWISEDPAGFVDGPNRYAYVRNSPVRLFDPDGRQAQALPIIVICSPDPVTKAALIAAGVAAGAVIIYKACEDGNCFGDNDKDKKKDPNTCKRLLELCLESPMQPPHRQKQWGKRKDCGACFRECNAAGGAWPFYKCPIF